ncbi:hypothetical protein IL972_00315 [Acinetobacter sp. FL51]|uniref:hypothetical protein n=1 Tax=Acinetobacter sp. FL51 TaxID=2777978 RepID=UPI0018E19571|nr:hypothetical protein [Acinetobacter sp. FL51]MBI1450381.1 hypothetical protein [Acinetobacter sp. FL51]
MTKKIAIAASGVEIFVDIENASNPNKANWIIRLPDGGKVKMNPDGKTFKSKSHGQDFTLQD